MLILTRKSDESIKIGDEITITVVEIRGASVRLGINAPSNFRIYRSELYERIKRENLLSMSYHLDEFNKISKVLKLK